MKLSKWIFILLVLASCNQKERGAASESSAAHANAKYAKGLCFDKVISPYVYQIAQVEGQNIFYFALDRPSKEVLSGTVTSLFKGEDPFNVVDCP